MKKMIAVLGLVLALPYSVAAAPYFRTLDLSHPYLTAGALVDPIDPARTTIGTDLAIVTHTPGDGCILKVYCEDWSPFMLGGSVGAGNVYFDLGPSVNIATLIKQPLYALLTKATPPSKYIAVKSLLAPPLDGTDGLTVSIGPRWMVRPLDKWAGRFVLFAGAAIRFGR